MEPDDMFELCESFQIDNGQLDGFTPQECFVFGWELCRISEWAETKDEEFTVLFHLDNRERIQAALEKRDRAFATKAFHQDSSETWGELTVFER